MSGRPVISLPSSAHFSFERINFSLMAPVRFGGSSSFISTCRTRHAVHENGCVTVLRRRGCLRPRRDEFLTVGRKAIARFSNEILQDTARRKLEGDGLCRTISREAANEIVWQRRLLPVLGYCDPLVVDFDRLEPRTLGDGNDH